MSLLEQLNVKVAAQNGRAALSEAQFETLRTFIYQKTGIYFQDNKRYLLESRIGRRLSILNMPDFEAYVAHIEQSGGARELPNLINEITINETYFFRNPPQFGVLHRILLPEIAEARLQEGKRKVRVWCAAASTGDEPYSLAFLIKEHVQPRFPGVQFEIIGTDINTNVLEVARRGIYGTYAVRNIPPYYLMKYFRKEGERYHLSDEIRRMVTFKHHNLMDRAGTAMMRGVDLILCANVLIYFDTESKQQVVSTFYNNLNPGGYLLVGFSETLYGVTQALHPVRFEKTIAYKRGATHA